MDVGGNFCGGENVRVRVFVCVGGPACVNLCAVIVGECEVLRRAYACCIFYFLFFFNRVVFFSEMCLPC